jgi:ubiquinone/menaquinone biosynthesis C-methylase UbiE
LEAHLYRLAAQRADVPSNVLVADPIRSGTARAQSAGPLPSSVVRAVTGDEMRLGFSDSTFDAVVLGLVLCSVPSVEPVLAEARRVLRRGGQLRALEHVRSESFIGGLLMDATNSLWLRLNRQGCNWNRQPIPKIEAAGFHVDDVHAFQRFDTLAPAFPMRRVRAHKPA